MRKVLIVDDEKMIRTSIVSMINWTAMNLECVGSCANALEALDVLTEEMPDILLTDIKMPVVSGLELVDRAKEMYPNLQCIILSGYAEFALAQEALQKDVQNYLLKPCSPEDLENVLLQCCENLDHQESTIEEHLRRREENIIQLLGSIRGQQENGKAISSTDLDKLSASYEDHSILREAMMRLVVEASPNWYLRESLSRLADAELSGNALSVVAADILAHLPKQSSEESYIQIIKKYVEQHYMDPALTLQFVADQVVYMNPKYIGKQFYKETGMHFGNYLMRIRLDCAKQLLTITPELKINNIAQQVGFGEHVQYFYQVFKKIEGVTPNAYRNEINSD